MNFNLIPESRRDARKRHTRMRIWIAVGAVYLALLLTGYAICHAMWAGDDGSLDEDLRETASRIEHSKREIKALKGKLEETKLALEANRAVGDQPDWSVLLGLLAKSLGDELVLSRCQLGPEPGSKSGPQSGSSASIGDYSSAKPDRFVLEITGLGRSQKAISQFVLRLEGTELFDEVTLVQTNREPFLSGNAVRFRVKCVLGQARASQARGGRSGTLSRTPA